MVNGAMIWLCLTDEVLICAIATAILSILVGIPFQRYLNSVYLMRIPSAKALHHAFILPVGSILKLTIVAKHAQTCLPGILLREMLMFL